MRLINTVRGAGYMAVAALGLALSGPTFAAPDDIVIVTTTPRLIGPRAGDQTVSLTRRISYADLDLSTSSGAKQLELRVQDVAHTLCNDLERRSALSPNMDERRACVDGAVADGMEHARAAIAAAARR